MREKMRGDLTGIEDVGYFLLSLFFVEDEEFVSVWDVNSVRSVAHVCYWTTAVSGVLRIVTRRAHATSE